MAYTPTNWQNLPDTTTPVVAQKLNNMETGIKQNDTVIGGDEYDSTATYEIGDFCIYNNKLYRCTTAISTAEVFTPAHWEETSLTEELQNTGKVIDDMDTSESQIVNAPSIHAVKDYFSIVTDYEITNQASHSSGTNTYELRKCGKVVTLTINQFYLNSISANTWTDLGQMPADIYPHTEYSLTGVITNTNTGNIVTYGRVVIRTNGSIAIKVSSGSSSAVAVQFSASWIIN